MEQSVRFILKSNSLSITFSSVMFQSDRCEKMPARVIASFHCASNVKLCQKASSKLELEVNSNDEEKWCEDFFVQEDFQTRIESTNLRYIQSFCPSAWFLFIRGRFWFMNEKSSGLIINLQSYRELIYFARYNEWIDLQWIEKVLC